jgi:hypothetical protein
MALFEREQFINSVGHTRIKSLFLELSYDNDQFHLFTLKDNDQEHKGKKLLSLKRIYLEYVPNDPTEYTFAMVVFGTWDIWDTIRRNAQIRRHYNKWKEEAEVKIKSEAIRSIAEEMRQGGKSSFTAAKLLLERGWIEKVSPHDRKTNKQKLQEEALDRQAMQMLSKDAERLGLKIN